ncbi:kinesin-like protein KIN-14B isoform X3 [Eucalyptus grandis]|uniref:kinesin-like protein KIN-14B isoform X3 n=1 Tax=Eucalyptus grandis TaxID=71139 RepID=UPI00192EAADD|nr:kinesin-like protein KIN-14B isoform X3 [Eucalyptus grandis]
MTSTGRGLPRPAVLDLRRLLAALAAPAGLQGPERLRPAEVVVDLRLLRRRRPAPAERPLIWRYSISAAASSSPSQLPLASKVQRLVDNVQLARQDYLELRQEASEVQEYSNVKLDRVTRYLSVLADKMRKLVALEGEARIAPLVSEKEEVVQ